MLTRAVFLSLAILGTVGLAATEQKTSITGPCTPNESWVLNGRFSKETKATLGSLLSDANRTDLSLEKALKVMDKSIAVIRIAKSPEEKLVASYAMSHLYLNIGYPHLAHSLFETSLLRAAPGDEGTAVKLAMLQCLNVLASRAPTLANRPELLPAIEALAKTATVAALPTIQEAEFHLLQQELRSGKPISRAAYSLLGKPGPYGLLGQALISQANRDYPGSVKTLSQFLSQDRGSADRYSDLAILLLARTQISLGNRSQAVEVLKKIAPTSNYFPEVLSDLGELHAEKNRFRESTDLLMNLQLGPLLKTFHPAAHVDLARSLTELCQYPAAYRMLQGYQSKYTPIRAYLDESLAGLGRQTLYGRIKTFLNDRNEAKSSAQATVVLEWMRSADFLANQLEINLLLDQKKMALSHLAAIKRLGGDRSLGQGGTAFLKSLRGFAKRIPSKEKALVANLEKKIQSTAQHMVAALTVSDSRASLLEADVLRLAGSGLIQSKPSPSSEAKVAAKKTDDLDWGRIPASELGSIEVWADELGSLKSLFENKCGG